VLRRVIVMTGMLVLASAMASAQARLTGADLGGTVSDQTGAVVPSCTITVTNVETNVSRTATSNAIGHFDVPALPPGRYTVSAALPGFRTRVYDDVELILGQAVTLNLVLTVVTATQGVTIAAPQPLLPVGHAEVSSVITQRQIEQLPVNGRNFIAFAVITPGVTTDRTPLQGATATSGLSFTGQRARSNNVMVDGLDNNDPFVGAVRATFSQEAVREFQVLTDSYSAEFGRAAGGVVNIVTKSGTNSLHGNTFLYLRDKSLNAKNYFDEFDVLGNPIALDKPPFRQKQWGGTLGGPIQRGKTFLFLAYERTDIADARLVTIPPASAAVLNRANFPVDIGNVPLSVRNSEFLAKIDHQWTTDRALSMRGDYADINREGVNDFGGTVARSRGTAQLRTNWSLSAAETDVLSSRWINELRAQYAYDNQRIEALDPACGTRCADADQGGPALDVTGVAALGRHPTTPTLRLDRRLQVIDTVSYVTGAHHVKAGGELNSVTFPREGNLLPAFVGGRFIFSAIPSLGVASSLDALEAGIPAAYVQGYGNAHPPTEAFVDLSLFAQDEWKRGRLIVRPGVRYQRQFWNDVTYHVSDVSGGSFSFPLASDGNNIAPRLGVSYDVTGRGHTIVHGSYGMFFDNTIFGLTTLGQVLNGSSDGLRTLILPAPQASIAWNAPGHRLEESQASALLGGSYVSAVVTPDPSLENSFTHQISAGLDRALGSNLALAVNTIYVRGFNLPGTLDYNPILPSRLGLGRRPNDLLCSTLPAAACVNGGIPGTSAPVLQYIGFGETWYKGLTVTLTKRLSHHHEFLLSYTLSKAEDSSTDYQSNFVPQNMGSGRNPSDRFGVPVGFDPDAERGPATHDQRHRLVASGFYQLPWDLQVSGIVTAASGRPFTPLAGADLNGDGNGGAFPPDRARRDPADESTSVGRNSETTAAQVNVDVRLSRRVKLRMHGTLDAMVEAFNLFNRANFIEETNQSSFVIFGTGAFPTNPLPAYGRYTATLAPRQVQVAVKLGF